MKNLAIFDLDNTLINTDSDHSWPQYLIKKGIVDAAETEAQNEKFYQDYQNGCLDIDAFLKFHLAPLARFSKEELAEFHREFMAEYIVPHISPMQRMLVQSHQMAGDEMLVISSTNEFIITPICHLFGIHNIIGTQLETGEDGRYTGNYVGTPSLVRPLKATARFIFTATPKTIYRCCVSWTNLSPSIRMPSWKKKPKQKVGRF